MPLEIAGMNFTHLSGPIGMCLLTPSKSLISHLKKGCDAIPICGFQDIHWSLEKNCYELNLCKENDTNCVTLYTPVLYRLLDQVSSKEYSINLFMEIGFFPYLLKNEKLISPERLAVFDATDGSMTYIARRHAACLSTSRNTENELCFTANLKYHLSDIRYQPEYVKLTEDEKKLIRVANKLVKESPYTTFPLKDLYSIAKDMLDTDKTDKTDKTDREDITHFPTFESYMLDAIKKCCQRPDVTFYDMKAIDLLTLAVTDANAFVNRIIKFPQWLSRSVFADRMSCSIFPFNFLVTMMKQYITFAFERRKQAENQKDMYEQYLQVLTTLNDNVFLFYYQPKFTYLRLQGSKDRFPDERLYSKQDLHDFQEAKINVDIVYEARNFFKEILDDAIMEFYFLLTSWKKEHNNSLLSIFSAGATHIKNVRFFMQTYGYYNTQCFQTTKHQRTRCVAFIKDNFSLSKWLSHYWMKMNPKKQTSLYHKLGLQTRRVQVLGNDIMYKILNGNAIPSSEINANFVAHHFLNLITA
jgi:hypothetical protein